MRFALGDHPPVDDPPAEAIAQGLKDLDGSVNTFAVLFASDSVFVQAAGNVREGFVLEYNDGVGLYRAANRPPLEVVTRVFQHYASGQHDWREELQWRPFDPSRATAKALWIILGLVALACVLWLVVARLLHL